VARRFLVARLISWLNTLWENRPIPLWIVLGSGLGSGMGAALGLFSLQQWEWVTGLAENPGPYAGVGHLLSSVVQGFAWLAVGLPVGMINFLLCRPKYEYGCVDGYGMIYSLTIGIPMLFVLTVVLSAFFGAVVGGLVGFTFYSVARRMRR